MSATKTRYDTTAFEEANMRALAAQVEQASPPAWSYSHFRAEDAAINHSRKVPNVEDSDERPRMSCTSLQVLCFKDDFARLFVLQC